VSKPRIRAFRSEDSAEIGRLFYDTIRAINARDYTPAEITAWAPDVPAPQWAEQRAKTRLVFVAENATGLLGFAELRPRAKHLDCLYTRHDAQGRGVATALLREIEEQAHRYGIFRLQTEASITARPFFERRGFRLLARQEVERNGVKLTNFKMEKILQSRAD
jgi:putative acetyltransferase